MRRPKLCEGGCGRAVRRIRSARFCSPCIGRIPKKTCVECGEDFHVDRMNGPRCRPCASAKVHAKRVAEVYSITAAEYAALLAAQGGACYVCRRKPGAKRLAVDHDHSCCPGPVSCGRCVRGLLCKHDNFYLIGGAERADDAIAYLERAVAYLKNPPAREVLKRDATTG